jgi:excisionase family DNA binding protein
VSKTAPVSPVSTQDRLLALPDVAAQLACSEGLVRRLGARGVLPRVKLGRLVRYRASDVARLVAEGVPRAA